MELGSTPYDAMALPPRRRRGRGWDGRWSRYWHGGRIQGWMGVYWEGAESRTGVYQDAFEALLEIMEDGVHTE